MLDETTDRATFAGRVATLEQDRHPLAFLLNPALQLDQLDLQRFQFVFIDHSGLDLADVQILGSQQPDESRVECRSESSSVVRYRPPPRSVSCPD